MRGVRSIAGALALWLAPFAAPSLAPPLAPLYAQTIEPANGEYRGQGGGAAPAPPAAPAGAATRVVMELVLAVDVSTSVSAEEYALQRIGLFRAFRDPAVRASILTHGERGIAVSVIHWAGKGRQRVAIDWSHINSEDSLGAFVRKLGAMQRLTGGFTDIAGAVRFATRSLLTNAYEGERLVIDVSGDGIADQGSPPAARDEALGEGIIINGLAILPSNRSSSDALLAHYRFDVTGGPGSFVIAAQSFEDFPRAMREKLIREISGPAFASRPSGPALATRPRGFAARPPGPAVLPASTGGDGAL